jgi:hypothetical protein
MTRDQENRRLGLALVLLILAFALYGQCAEAAAAECHSGDISVRDEGDEILACVNGEWMPMLTLEESESKSTLASVAAGIAGAIGGLLVGAGVERSRR